MATAESGFLPTAWGPGGASSTVASLRTTRSATSFATRHLPRLPRGRYPYARYTGRSTTGTGGGDGGRNGDALRALYRRPPPRHGRLRHRVAGARRGARRARCGEGAGREL